MHTTLLFFVISRSLCIAGSRKFQGFFSPAANPTTHPRPAPGPYPYKKVALCACVRVRCFYLHIFFCTLLGIHALTLSPHAEEKDARVKRYEIKRTIVL